MAGPTGAHLKLEDMQKSRDEFTIAAATQRFFDRWAPKDPDERTEFERDVFMLVRRIYLDAQEPSQRALTAIMMNLPSQPIVPGGQ